MNITIPLLASSWWAGASGTRMSINTFLNNWVTTLVYTVPAWKNFITTNVWFATAAQDVCMAYSNITVTAEFPYYFGSTRQTKPDGIIFTSGQTIYMRAISWNTNWSISGILYDN
jgi:hypothetical protein